MVAPVHIFTSAVSTSADMELELAEVWHLVVGIEGTQEHMRLERVR